MILDRIQHYLGVAFLTLLIITQASVFVAVKASNNDDLLRAIFVEPVNDSMTIGESIYFQAMLSNSEDSQFDLVYFNLKNFDTGLDENYEASLQTDGSWLAQSIWDTSYDYQPGEYYLSLVAHDNAEGQLENIYYSQIKAINLNGEYQAAAVTDTGYFEYPSPFTIINPNVTNDLTAVLYLNSDESARFPGLQFRLVGQEEQPENEDGEIVGGGLDDFVEYFFPNLAENLGPDLDNPGFDRWESTISLGDVVDGQYNIDILTNSSSGEAIEISTVFIVARTELPALTLTPEIEVLSPLEDHEGYSINRGFDIKILSNIVIPESHMVIAAVSAANGTGERILPLQQQSTNPLEHLISMDFDELAIVDAEGNIIDANNVFVPGEYTIEFYLLSRDDPSADRVALLRSSFTLVEGEEVETIDELILINESDFESRIIGDGITLNFETNFSAETFSFAIVKKDDSTMGLYEAIPLVGDGTSWTYTVSASENGFSNGRYILNGGASVQDEVTAQFGPKEFYWQITEEDIPVDPSLAIHVADTNLSSADLLIGSGNITNPIFLLENTIEGEMNYTLSPSLVDCASAPPAIISQSIKDLALTLGHNNCFWYALGSDMGPIVNNGNYWLSLQRESLTEPVIVSSRELITYFDGDNIIEIEEELLGTLEINSVSVEGPTITIDTIDYINNADFVLENIDNQLLYSQDNIDFSIEGAYYAGMDFGTVSLPVGTYKIYFRAFIEGVYKWTNQLPYLLEVAADGVQFIAEDEDTLFDLYPPQIGELTGRATLVFPFLTSLQNHGTQTRVFNTNDELYDRFHSHVSVEWEALEVFDIYEVDNENILSRVLVHTYLENEEGDSLFEDGDYYMRISMADNSLETNKVYFTIQDGVLLDGHADDGQEENAIVEDILEPIQDEQEDLTIDFFSTCYEEGISDEETCARFRATMDLFDPTCVEQGIYEDIACEDYLYRIETDLECQENNVIDREECKNYLLEKYGSQVDCQLADANLCNSILRNEYLNRLVSGQRLSQNINQAVDSLIGQNISTQDLSDALEDRGIDSQKVLPLSPDQNTKVLLSRSQKETVLEEKDRLTVLNQAIIILDADGDGLSDDLEAYYGTEINNPDTDGDGYSDGEEIINGYDPVGPGKLIKERTNFDIVTLDKDKVIEQPKIKSKKIDNKMEVFKVDAQENKLNLSGKAEANTWVNLYLYSSLPLVMTTKTDASGNWSYDIKDSLTDGHHRVFVTVNDDTGRIVKQSRPISFLIKEARAVTVDDYFDETSSGGATNNLFIYYILGGVFLVFLALGVIVFLHKGKNQDLEI
jgi:hypothetical protein